jgi:hypothetical protein
MPLPVKPTKQIDAATSKNSQKDKDKEALSRLVMQMSEESKR